MILTKHFPIIQILFPLFGALLSIISFRFIIFARVITIICILSSLLVSIYGYNIIQNTELSYTIGGWTSNIGIEYHLNPLNQATTIYLNLVLLFFLVCCHKITNRTILQYINNNRKSLFYGILLFAHTGYLGMISTNDFFNLYVFIEMSALSSYVLIASGNNPKSLVGAFDYLIMGSIGATFILIAIGFLLSITGSLNMYDIAAYLKEYTKPRIITIVIGFFLIGSILKTAFFPMHFWMIRAYNNTASIILVYLAGISTIIGIYIIYKFTYIIIGYETIKTAITNFIRPIALASLIIAPYFAYQAKDFKNIIIYSCFTQIGYIFLLYSTKNCIIMLPSLLLIDSINKMSLFLIAAYNESYKKAPNKILTIIIIICSCGLPISPLFFIKINILEILLAQSLLLDFVIILLSSVVSLFYHYKMILLSLTQKYA
ncbi:proton-conducting transporter transmembrane domain-containing protein [Rickettsia typhi]|uniref:HyfB domain containing protein n=2 Tax=Rickettsia typhi TaxID=785 RepID=Q68X87_RICTY|nr:proton-conducting transporter membrane subunit [Rickettsia typhi]AAU03755.1 HyfB domain containing protein [Rickettsia typhi str. Wilmington]AFE54132.1 putative monovalent cation/H+ antiporter subunit D [Rickettsia typhi str. TH1527]AFE54971.1 putative monovalent cation/H+ antiporter subunit D [Rickettsia typhi str. B9991CWPP]